MGVASVTFIAAHTAMSGRFAASRMASRASSLLRRAQLSRSNADAPTALRSRTAASVNAPLQQFRCICAKV